jgi:UDP-GlcNAc:undecaprenyl-phosphate GlcNAc-1-phosphate transferase
MTDMQRLLICAATAAGICVGAVFVAMRISRKTGLTSRPGSDRWSKKATPLLGGAALLAGFVVSYVILGTPDARMVYILVTAGFVFALGLFDDIFGLKPNMKLIGQCAAACFLIYGGIYVDIWFPVVGIPLSIAWFVGLSNAVNLLDNMDGVASGVCAVSAAVLVFHASSSGYPQIALAAAALCGSCTAFTFFNFHPARIFMGDSGSLFLGITLAALGVTATYREATNVLTTLLVPVMVLAVPLFDMFFVTVLRKGHGRSITVGGRDHSAHRLVSLGLSERKTAVLFYVICLALGAASILAKMGIVLVLLVAAITGAALLLAAFALSRVKVYDRGPDPESKLLAARLFGKYRRAAGLVLFDMFAIAVSYIAAYFIRFDWRIPANLEAHIPVVLPAILIIKLLALAFFKVYQVKWEKVERADIWRLFLAVSVGSALSVITTAIESKFELFLVSVLTIDWLFCIVLLCCARLLLPVITGPLGNEEDGA